jgi:AcrR family transcriptional regulator
MYTLAFLTDYQTGTIPRRYAKTINEIATAASLHRATVIRHLAALEESGWLIRDRASGQRIAWALRIPERSHRTPPEESSKATGNGRTEQPPPIGLTGLTKQTKAAAQPDGFAEFWKIYPRRVGKAAAQRKWDTAIKNRVDPLKILAGAQRYADAMTGGDPRFIAHPATWLHQGRWDDDAAAIRPPDPDGGDGVAHGPWQPMVSPPAAASGGQPWSPQA